MAGLARIPRSRGAVSGVLLILLGAWGGLAPFVGPYFRFAYTPDKAWAYTSGRLWLSIVPGAAALIGGLLVAGTAHRGVGCLGAVLAAAGGAWFILGTAVISVTVTNGSISPGVPLAGPLGSLSSVTRVFLERLGFFTGIGAVILFLGALALGRFTVVGVRDGALAEGDELPASAGAYHEPERATEQLSYPATTGQFPAAGSEYGQGAPTEQAPTAPEQYPTTTSPFRRPPAPGPGPLSGPS
jgi:hypothetical protein